MIFNLFQHRRPDPRLSSSNEVSNDFPRLITDNLPYIEQQCRRAVLRQEENEALLENEADELLNEVLDRLKVDDFKALRQFQGKAKLTTYITTIISNLIVDLVRQKKGRSRARERAREMGEAGERLYELVFERGLTLHEAHSCLSVNHGITKPLEMVQEMLDRMRGRERPQLSVTTDGEAVWLVPGTRVTIDDEVEIVVTDPRKNAEAALISNQKASKASSAVSALLSELGGEDRLMLKMRFPDDEEEVPKSVKEIASLLGLTEKSVDARIRRILLRFRETLLSQGVGLSDLIEV